jgi:hypothetical protein
MSTIDTSQDAALVDNLRTLKLLLAEATARVAEAEVGLREANRNAAMGALVGVDQMLGDAVALHRALLALHRQAR